jgi:hypothetical protein
MNSDDRSPGKKAQYTAKWARTMTKWLITFSRRSGARWNLVDFGGKTKAESRGIVDLLAVRKNHQEEVLPLKRGDLFDMVLIQTKGGSSPRPTAEDIIRLPRSPNTTEQNQSCLQNGTRENDWSFSDWRRPSGCPSHLMMFLGEIEMQHRSTAFTVRETCRGFAQDGA